MCTAENYQNLPVIASDGAGGAIVAWPDPRNPNLGTDVYAQWLDPSGFPRWTADGIPVCSAANNQDAPVMVPEGAGGAIVGWEDYRDGQSDIYAMRIGDQPIAVAITSFNAVENEGAVILRGTFRSDIGIDRVNVYRAAGTDADPFVRIDAIYDARTAVFEYVDGDVTPGRTYSYRIGVSDADGEIVSPTIAVSVSPLVARLDQNWPNPFNPSTRIRFVVPERGHVEVMVYDAAGQVVRTLVDGVQGHGAHEIIWDGRDNNGTPVSSGVYLCRMQVGIRSASRKMVLIR